MTDSDFFTESDADDVLHRGDRRAQVIDGQLYGPTLNPTAEVPQHQQPMDDSCMDSSGIFTDAENRQEFDIEMSPDISTDTVKMVIEDEDTSNQKALHTNKSEEEKSSPYTKSTKSTTDTLVQKCKSKKNAIATSPTQSQTPPSNEKCEVVNDKKNTIKLNIRKNSNMLIPSSKTPSPTSGTASSSLLRKTATTTTTLTTPNKWDAVMNKIANNKAQIAKKNYSEVKSKISTGVVNGKKSPVAATADAAAKGNLNDSIGSGSGLVSPQTKRLQQGAAKRGRSYSQQSSQSDLSSSGASPKLSLKTPPRAAKKRDVRNLSISPCDQGPPAKAHQLLNGSSSRLKVQSQHLSQKRVTPPNVKSSNNKQVPVQSRNSPKDQKLTSAQKIANGGSKINTNGQDAKVQANIQIAVVDKETNTEFQNTKDVEALGVLIQYLVHELDAFSTPQYKRDYEKAKNNLTKTILHLDEAKISCQSLQEQLETKDSYYLNREDELQNLHLSEISKVEDKLNELNTEANQRVQHLETRIEEISAMYKKQLQEKSESIDILQVQLNSMNQRISQHVNNENELRENIHKSEMEYSRKINSASAREKSLLEQITVLKQQLESNSKPEEHSLNLTPEELSILRSPSSRLSNSSSKADSIQEIDSLRCVLELKLHEISKLKKQNQELVRESEENQSRSSKISTLENRLEDLQSKFELKCDENCSLQDKFVTLEKKHTHDSQMRTQLSYDKEQLQYQLRQKSEQLHCLEEQFKHSFNCSNLSILSQDDFLPSRNSSAIEITDCSPAVSPLKQTIEKPNSISWIHTWDDETPRDAANKIVRRAGSFRSMCNPLSQSASATQINSRQSLHSNGSLRARSKSMSIKNNERQNYARQNSVPATKQKRSEVLQENLIDFDDNDVFESDNLITCDTSELVKPNKKKLKTTLIRKSAGEAMIFSTNSEDEHCSASSEDLICSPSSSVTASSSSSTTSLDRTVSRDRKNFRLWEESLSDIRPMDV